MTLFKKDIWVKLIVLFFGIGSAGFCMELSYVRTQTQEREALVLSFKYKLIGISKVLCALSGFDSETLNILAIELQQGATNVSEENRDFIIIHAKLQHVINCPTCLSLHSAIFFDQIRDKSDIPESYFFHLQSIFKSDTTDQSSKDRLNKYIWFMIHANKSLNDAVVIQCKQDHNFNTEYFNLCNPNTGIGAKATMSMSFFMTWVSLWADYIRLIGVNLPGNTKINALGSVGITRRLNILGSAKLFILLFL